MSLHLPELSYKHMPIVKTARINKLIADKTKLMDDAAIIQHEINRLTEIEQSKVFRAYQRKWMKAGEKEYIDELYELNKDYGRL